MASYGSCRRIRYTVDDGIRLSTISEPQRHLGLGEAGFCSGNKPLNDGMWMLP